MIARNLRLSSLFALTLTFSAAPTLAAQVHRTTRDDVTVHDPEGKLCQNGADGSVVTSCLEGKVKVEAILFFDCVDP